MRIGSFDLNRNVKFRDFETGSFEKTLSVLKDGIEGGVYPGAVAGFWRVSDPDSFWVHAVGSKRKTPSILPMQVDTVFDLASLTKIMATAILTASLVERGWIQWNSKVSEFFPSYAYSDIEIRHLLSHTAGFEAWEPFYENLQEKFSGKKLNLVPVSVRQSAMRDLILSVKPDHPVDTKWLYSDISFLLLGFILEEVTGHSLDQAVKQQIWNTMSLSSMNYYRIEGEFAYLQKENVAATEDSQWRGGVLQGQVHDDNCWSMGGYAGHAGAFGNIFDVLGFAKILMKGHFLAPKTLKQMWAPVSLPQGCPRTLGWDTPTQPGSSVGNNFSARTVGHLGYTGTSLWLDLNAGLAVALLTNRVHPTRENEKIRSFRPLFHNALREDLRA